MKPAYPFSRLLHMLGQFATCAATGVTLVCVSLSAQADQLNQHDTLVNQYVTQMHANPLVADCAAHGNFIAGTSSVIDHVEFTPSSFDSTHSSLTPWNDAFDQGKQRTKVDTVVTVSGVGILRSGVSPIDLNFRCGYVDHQMMAFSWNDPVPAARHISGEPGRHHSYRRRGRHHHYRYVHGRRRYYASRSHKGHRKHASHVTRHAVRHHGKATTRKHVATKRHHVAKKATR